MQDNIIENKVKIFISSKCDSKYSIARKSLKTLLLETNMTIVYVFETAGAGSQPLEKSYLNKLDDSDLCIFLIDNLDGIPDPVLTEHKRARSLGKKSLYIFCDENRKEPTELQKEIIKTHTEKFVIIHEFNEFVERAYRDAINDIIDIYRAYCNGQIYSRNDTSETNAIIKEYNAYKLYKSLFKGFDLTKNELLNRILGHNTEIKETSELDKIIKDFLLVLIGNISSDTIDFSDLSMKVCLLHKEEIKEFVSARIKIIELYFSNDVEKCFVEIESLYMKYQHNDLIPNWLKNDLLIDMRYIENIIDETKNRYSIQTKGQDLLDKNNEYLHYPLLDRYCANLNEDIIKRYIDEYIDTPYTVHIGSIDSIFETIANTFIVAVIFGSLIQILLVTERLIDALTSLCLIYHDTSLYIELIKLLLFSQKDADIKKVIRAFNQTTDMINEIDISKFSSSIELVKLPHKRLVSKLLLFKYYGYYFPDMEYEQIASEVINDIEKWINDDNRLIRISNHIFEALINNIRRIDNEKVIQLCLMMYKKRFKRFYDDILNIICNINYLQISKEINNEITKLLTDIIDDTETRNNYINLERALITFRLNSKHNKKKLDAKIKEKMSEFFKTDYSINFVSKNRESIKRHLKYYIDIINQQTRTQGTNGTYFGYTDNPYQVIINLIDYTKYQLEISDLENILHCIENTLLSKTQTIHAKNNSIQLLVYIKNKFNFDDALGQTIEKLRKDKELVLSGHVDSLISRDSINTLRFNFLILELCFKINIEHNLLSAIAGFTQAQEYEIIISLQAIDALMNNIGDNSIDDYTLPVITQYVIGLCGHKEKDIRLYCVKILLALSKTNVKSLALYELSKIMDNDIYIIKIAIINGIRKLQLNKEKENIIDYIYQKGRIDNNYLVRKSLIK